MHIRLIGTVAALAVGTAAFAQSTPSVPAQSREAWMAAHKAEFAQMRQRRGDDIALLLGLRADQRPALDAMMAAAEPQHREWGKDGGRPPMPDTDETTMARLDHMAARIDERGAAAKARLDAVKRFYASLTPDQQKRFDALDRLRHDHMGPHGHRDGHGGPGRGPDMPPPSRG